MKHFRLVVAALLCVAVAGGLVGCQRIAEEAAESAAEKATGAKIEKDGDSLTIEGKEGEKATIGQNELPSDFPSDVPVYAGATVTASFEQGDAAKKTTVVTFETTDDSAKVNEWYVSELEAKGWKIESKANQGTTYMVNATKGANTLSVTIAGDQANNKTIINIAVAPK